MGTAKKVRKFIPVVITPPSSLELPDFRELWEYRGLLFFLVRRDIMVRFQQTVIGFLWIVVQPLIQMLIFNMLFGVLVKVDTGDVPFTLFFLSAFVVWQFFTQVVNSSAYSLVGNIGIITKAYFPRLALPISTVFGSLVDFGISFLILMIFLLPDGRYPINERYLLIPFLLLLTTIFASGVGMLFGALMVTFRDMKNLLAFIITIWMYLTPILYPISIVPKDYQILFYLNPLTSLINSYRWVFLRVGELPQLNNFLISLVVGVIIWFWGAVAFRSMENKISDVM